MIIEKSFFVYIMTNHGNTVLYTGVTSDLPKRVFQHKEKLAGGFTSKYHVNKLVYYEPCTDAESAILREKQLKGGSIERKLRLIRESNPDWRDLSMDW